MLVLYAEESLSSVESDSPHEHFPTLVIHLPFAENTNMTKHPLGTRSMQARYEMYRGITWTDVGNAVECSLHVIKPVVALVGQAFLL